MSEQPITNPAEIEALMRDDAAAIDRYRGPVRKLHPDEQFIPKHLTPRLQTCAVEVDGELPVIVLFRALSAHGISIINKNGRLLLTLRPEAFR